LALCLRRGPADVFVRVTLVRTRRSADLEAVDEERRPHPEASDHDAGDGRADDPGEVEPGGVDCNGARHVGTTDHLHHERLPRRLDRKSTRMNATHESIQYDGFRQIHTTA